MRITHRPGEAEKAKADAIVQQFLGWSYDEVEQRVRERAVNAAGVVDVLVIFAKLLLYIGNKR